jgi:hypothetical protein
MESKTKQELQIMLKEAYNENIELVKKIELEIIYREDDEKRLKYEPIRKNDPLKDSFKKIYMNYIIDK